MTEPIFISLLELLWARLAATIASACASISGTLIVTVTSAIRGALIKPIDRFSFHRPQPPARAKGGWRREVLRQASGAGKRSW